MVLEKKKALFKAIAQDYTPPSMNIGDPEKYYWPKTIARLELYGEKDSLANNWIYTFSNRSPFHFTLVGMVRILFLYPNAPAIKKNRVTIIGKVFDRTDSYNCWTAEGTENHINMSRTSGYLYAQEALRIKYRQEEAQLHMRNMKSWLLAYRNRILENGNAEWNSGIYGLYNLIGWLNLYDFAEDEEVKLAAKQVCDYYAAEAALHYSWGVVGGAEMRGNGIGHNVGNSSAFLGWFWFGENAQLPIQRGREYIQLVHPATSNFQPNPALLALAQKRISQPFEAKLQMPDYGIKKQGFCQNKFYASPFFTLGSSQNSYGGWTGSTSQIVSWKMVGKPVKEGETPFQMSGNGLYYKDLRGKIRDPFTQVVQHNQTLVLLSFTPKKLVEIENEIQTLVKDWSAKWQSDFRKRFPMDREKENVVKLIKQRKRKSGSYLCIDRRAVIEEHARGWFVKMGDSYASISALSRGTTKLKKVPQEADFIFLEQTVQPETLSGFIVEFGDSNVFENFDGFKSKMQNTRLVLKDGLKIAYTDSEGKELEVSFEPNGTFEEAIVDWGYGITSPQIETTEAQFVQPNWPIGFGHGKMAKVQPAHSPMKAVISCPYIHLENRKLELNPDGLLQVIRE